MPTPVYTSRAYALLLLLLPGVWLFARAIVRRLTTDLGLRAVLPIGLSIALWIVSIQLTSLALRSFLVGLPLATSLLAGAGVVAEIKRRRDGDDERAPATGRRPSPWMWITALATTLLIAPSALRYWVHDEILVGHHLAAISQMSHVFPPLRIQWPEYPFQYHYGIDLVSAAWAAIFHLRADDALDVSSISLWTAAWCLLWTLGERLVGRRYAGLTPFMTLFAGGMPITCAHGAKRTLAHLMSECPVGHYSLNSCMMNYWFQHPWALAIPMLATTLLVFSERSPRSPRLRLVLLAITIGLISFSELPLFVTSLPCLVVAELFYEGELELGRAKGILAASAGAIVLAKLLGGFLTDPAGLERVPMVLHLGFENTPELTLQWNVLTFGAMWITGALGLASLRRGVVFFGLLSGGSLLVVNLFRYAQSADIMKFATIVSLGLGVLGSAAIARLLADARRLRSTLLLAGAFALLVGATWDSALYPVILALQGSDLPGPFQVRPADLSADDVQVVDFLNAHRAPRDLMFRTHGDAYAYWVGIPYASTDWTTKQWGIPRAKVVSREALLRDRPVDVAAWRSEGFRWIVLDETSRDDRSLVDATNAWIARGDATLAARRGALRIVDLARP